MRTIFTTLFAIGLVIACYAQNDSASAKNQHKRTWALSIYGGLSQFYGDLREYKFWPIQENNFDSQPELGTWHTGIALKHRFSPIFGVRADAGMGTLNGTKRRIYFSYFRTNYTQATVSATLNLKNLLPGITREDRWEVEINGGVGMIRFRLAYHGQRAAQTSFNCQLITHFSADIPMISLATQDIGRVLLNLFNNAFYALQQKQQLADPPYEPTIWVSTFLRGSNTAEIRIRDNGMGIPKAIIQKIFQPFFTTKPTGEGTGLGLSLSYDIITKAHQGMLDVVSTEGEGTEFIITLPLDK